MPDDVRKYLEEILEEANMHTLDQQMKDGMVDELFYQLNDYLATVIAESLQEQDLEEFIKMNEEKKPREEIEAFVNAKVPNARQVFAQALVGFREMYLENVSTARANKAEPK